MEELFYTDIPRLKNRCRDLNLQSQQMLAKMKLDKVEIDKLAKEAGDIIYFTYALLSPDPSQFPSKEMFDAKIEMANNPFNKAESWTILLTHILGPFVAGVGTGHMIGRLYQKQAINWFRGKAGLVAEGVEEGVELVSMAGGQAVRRETAVATSAAARTICRFLGDTAVGKFILKGVLKGGPALAASAAVEVVISAIVGAIEEDKLQDAVRESTPIRVHLKVASMLSSQVKSALDAIVTAFKAIHDTKTNDDGMPTYTEADLNQLRRNLLKTHMHDLDSINEQAAKKELDDFDRAQGAWTNADGLSSTWWRAIGMARLCTDALADIIVARSDIANKVISSTKALPMFISGLPRALPVLLVDHRVAENGKTKEQDTNPDHMWRIVPAAPLVPLVQGDDVTKGNIAEVFELAYVADKIRVARLSIAQYLLELKIGTDDKTTDDMRRWCQDSSFTPQGYDTDPDDDVPPPDVPAILKDPKNAGNIESLKAAFAAEGAALEELRSKLELPEDEEVRRWLRWASVNKGAAAEDVMTAYAYDNHDTLQGRIGLATRVLPTIKRRSLKVAAYLDCINRIYDTVEVAVKGPENQLKSKAPTKEELAGTVDPNAYTSTNGTTTAPAPDANGSAAGTDARAPAKKMTLEELKAKVKAETDKFPALLANAEASVESHIATITATVG